MFHMGVVRFFHFVHTSMFICFSFFNLHLHPGGFVNKMTKIYIFYVSAENSIFTVLAKIFLQFLKKNVCFDEKIHFCGFGGKYVFMGLAEKYVFYGFGEKSTFCGFGRKCVFDEKVCVCGFDGKLFSLFW